MVWAVENEVAGCLNCDSFTVGAGWGLGVSYSEQGLAQWHVVGVTLCDD